MKMAQGKLNLMNSNFYSNLINENNKYFNNLELINYLIRNKLWFAPYDEVMKFLKKFHKLDLIHLR